MMTTKNLKKIAMALALAGSAAVPLAAQAQAASRGYEVSALAEGRVLVETPGWPAAAVATCGSAIRGCSRRNSPTSRDRAAVQRGVKQASSACTQRAFCASLAKLASKLLRASV